jgi:hypothetical protein
MHYSNDISLVLFSDLPNRPKIISTSGRKKNLEFTSTYSEKKSAISERKKNNHQFSKYFNHSSCVGVFKFYIHTRLIYT